MKTIVFVAVLIIAMMSGMAVADTETGWDYGKRNVAPEGIEHAYWDFEEGTNLDPFNNNYPDVAVFMNVNAESNPDAMFAVDEPSYVVKCATTGGGSACKMYIYPCNTVDGDGIPFPCISILNGNAAFSPRTGPDLMGGYWPGRKAYADFKDDTHYISFLASTHGTLYVNLYDKRGKRLHSENIYKNTDRVGDEPSKFTRFSVHLSESVGSMSLSGPFNGWHIDDLIVGGDVGYLPGRRDYGYAAERMKTLIGAKFLEHGLGYDLVMERFYSAEEIINDDLMYWNPETKEVMYECGIYDQYAIVWAFNEGDDIVNYGDITDQAKRDFTEKIDYEDIRAGDVFFIDYPTADGQYDEVGMVVEPETIDGVVYDIIRIVPGGGVHYDKSSNINELYNSAYGFVDYRSLPDSPKGGHSPYPKVPNKQLI